MDGAHVHGQPGALEAHGDENPAVGGLARLTAHPAGPDRGRGPDHEHDRCLLQFSVDLAVELLTGIDFRVPPDRPALGLDGADQRRDSRLVEAGVGNKDISHARSNLDWGPAPRDPGASVVYLATEARSLRARHVWRLWDNLAMDFTCIG
jgi:hypothetical protein